MELSEALGPLNTGYIHQGLIYYYFLYVLQILYTFKNLIKRTCYPEENRAPANR